MAAPRPSPFTASALGGRVLSGLQLPLFALLPPSGYGVLTTRGRKTGKVRRRCVRAIRSGDRAYLVAIKGPRTGWARNARANPNVRLRVRGGAFQGVARDARDAAEAHLAAEVYRRTVTRFDYLTYRLWRTGRPTRARVEALLGAWCEEGSPLIVELRGRAREG